MILRGFLRKMKRLNFAMKLIFIILLLFLGSFEKSFPDEIHDVVKNGDICKLENILENNPNLVNAKNNNTRGESPLHIVIERKAFYREQCYTKIVNLLISKGANINIVDNWGQTPLHYAAQMPYRKDNNKYQSEMALLLLSKGAIVDSIDKRGNTPLNLAAFLGNDKIVELLVKKGADVNKKGDMGCTPLLSALSSSGIYDAEMDDSEEIDKKYKRTVFFLVSHGADLNAKNNFGETSLHCAIKSVPGRKNALTYIKLFISKGANVNTKDTDGHSPLYYAIKDGRSDITDILRKHGAKE